MDSRTVNHDEIEVALKYRFQQLGGKILAVGKEDAAVSYQRIRRSCSKNGVMQSLSKAVEENRLQSKLCLRRPSVR
ncbi:hypothetical protein CHS0354_032519 [Potamilus streckersoni]|uniref:Uncharacterized protein n=1 Tax=Potamilus streckersoni TaxID=2493646 RepID=A0AAE0SPW3_9BIVA|nr:hypothetical protein CHS0354_032519 [Potamilus streckersoni]